MESRPFTDRESGTYGGLMLSLRDFRDRLVSYPGFQLNMKPREIDCLIIDKCDPDEPMDNDIARFFRKHNIIELKNPQEALNINTVWKVISYAAQYKSEGTSDDPRDASDITITILRAAKPKKALRQLKEGGYTIENAYPGIYYIGGMVDMRMQIVVSSELEGDDYVPLRIQQKNADRSDYLRFVEKTDSVYTEDESDLVSMVLKNGLNGSEKEVTAMAWKNTRSYKNMKAILKDEFEECEANGIVKGIAKGEAKGIAKGEEERKKLQAENEKLKKEIKKLQSMVGML